MRAVPGQLHAKWHYLRSTESFRRAPLRTLSRLAVWRLRCAIGASTVVSLRLWGARFFLPPQWRGVAKLVYAFREQYEPELEWLRDRLRPGDVMLDVGACHGIYTVLGARRVGSHGRVIAFEPAREAFEVLQHNLALNGFGNVTAVCAAAGATEGWATLYHDPDPGRNSLGATRAHPDDSENVPVTTVDAVLSRHSITQIAVLKIDAEGSEADVLRGATRLLNTCHPAVLFEINPAASSGLGHSYSDAAEILRAIGYKMFRVQGGRAEPLSEIPRGGNVVALYQ